MAILLMTTVVTAGAQDASVAVVNIEKIFRGHPAFREVQQKLQDRKNEMRTELKEMGKEKAKTRQKEMQQELQKLQQKLVAKAAEEVKKDIGDIANKLGFEIVLNPAGIITGKEELGAEDITKDVLAEVKEKYDLN